MRQILLFLPILLSKCNVTVLHNQQIQPQKSQIQLCMGTVSSDDGVISHNLEKLHKWFNYSQLPEKVLLSFPICSRIIYIYTECNIPRSTYYPPQEYRTFKILIAPHYYWWTLEKNLKRFMSMGFTSFN